MQCNQVRKKKVSSKLFNGVLSRLHCSPPNCSSLLERRHNRGSNESFVRVFGRILGDRFGNLVFLGVAQKALNCALGRTPVAGTSTDPKKNLTFRVGRGRMEALEVYQSRWNVCHRGEEFSWIQIPSRRKSSKNTLFFVWETWNLPNFVRTALDHWTTKILVGLVNPREREQVKSTKKRQLSSWKSNWVLPIYMPLQDMRHAHRIFFVLFVIASTPRRLLRRVCLRLIETSVSFFIQNK